MSERDFISKLVEDEAMYMPESGSRRLRLDLEKLFSLAEANGLDVSTYRGLDLTPMDYGRVRMNIGNALRGALRRQSYVVRLDGSKAYPGETQDARSA